MLAIDAAAQTGDIVAININVYVSAPHFVYFIDVKLQVCFTRKTDFLSVSCAFINLVTVNL